MKTLYFDCFSGISGDMTIGALLDLGLDLDYLKTELKKLRLEGYEVRSSRVVRANISAMKFDVLMGDGELHEHAHGAGKHEHFHRKASEILRMIGESKLSRNAREMATAIFTKLAISEGQVHQISPQDVEFHEVGAVDSIVDVVGTAIGFDALGIDRFLCSPINVGAGFIHCQHGIYPVPAPATADLLKQATIYSRHADTELVTPTGAAILAAVVNSFEPLSGFAIERIGYGAGQKQLGEFPNCLRLMIGEEKTGAVPTNPSFTDVVTVEANLDDMTPQNLGYVAERLLEAGALDVFTTPIQMKKGRPGYLLQVLCQPDRVDPLSRIIFRETTTIGLRMRPASRKILERESVAVETGYGPVSVKVSRLDGEVVNVAPEYEECARLARKKGIPLKKVQALALKKYLEAADDADSADG